MSSSQKFSGRGLLPLTLLGGILLGLGSGCARSTAADEPEVAPQQQQEDAIADSTAIPKRLHESLADVIVGRTSGVRVISNLDGTISVRIRGPGSFYGNQEPLFVIDGVPVIGAASRTVAGINPYDIESIRVLKGPPETTLYGVRGANGVILITTRRPL